MSDTKIKEIMVGTRTMVGRGKLAIAHISAYLHRGEKCCNTYAQEEPAIIEIQA